MRFTFYSLILSCALVAQSATYHIDFDSGSDADAGTSSGAAWKHVPGDPDATGTAAATTPAPGDVLKFKGGVVYVSESNIPIIASGTAASPIVYDMTGSGYGTGQAIVTSTNAEIFMFAMTNKAFVTFLGGMVTNVGGMTEDDPDWTNGVAITSPPAGVGFYIRTSTNIVLDGVTMSEIGQWQNIAPLSGVNSVTGTSIAFRGGASNSVLNCEITRTGIGISIVPVNNIATDITVSNLYLHNYVNWGFDINTSANGQTNRNILITRSRLLNCREYDNNNWGGTGDSPHSNKIFMRTTGKLSYWENIVVSYCEFGDDDTNAVGGTSQVFLSEGPSIDIYFCKFGGRASPALLNVGYDRTLVPYQAVRVWNCSFVSNHRLFQNNGNEWNGDLIEILNCAFYRTASEDISNAATLNKTNMLSDYNLFFTGGNTNTWTPIVNFSSTYRTLDEWRAFSLQDSNSVIADPQMVSAGYLPWSSIDVRPLDGSYLLLGGSNLTSRLPNAVDWDGNALPTTGAWPIGVYGAAGSGGGGSSVPAVVAPGGTKRIGGSF